MVKQELQELVLQLQNTNSMELSKLVTFMLNRGYTLQQWRDISSANEHVLNALDEFFSTTDEIGLVRNNDTETKLNLNELKELSDLAKQTTKSNKNKENTKKENEKGMENKNLEVKPDTVETVTETNETKDVKDETAMTTSEGLTDGSNALQLPPTENENPENITPDTPAPEVTNPENITPDTSNPDNKTPEVTNPDTSKQEDKKDNPPADNNSKDDKTKDDKAKDDKKADNNAKTGKNTKKSSGKSDNNKPKAKTTASIRREYKTIDNLVSLTAKTIVDIEDVRQLTRDKFVTYINGEDLAELWLNHKLVFDPTMQRGVKTDKEGKAVATFSDYHVREIEDSMVKNEFEPTEIHLAILTDDPETKIEFDEDGKVLSVEGRIRLLDGQHRTRSLVKITSAMKVMKDYPTVDLGYYVFPVTIHYVTAERARIIYAMLNKNLKLDKSQVAQLMTSDYSNIVNFLNQDKNSVLRDKIATCKPVGNRLVLFSTLSDAIERQFKITIPSDREIVQNYLNEFFTYVTTKLTDAFGSDIPKRLAWKENNLLNENNFFYGWVAVAHEDKANYKKNVDKMIANIDYFNKKNPIWLKSQVVKYKVSDKDKADDQKGFAMSNSDSAFKAIIENTLALIRK